MSRLRTLALLCVAVLFLPLPGRPARADEKEEKFKPLTEFLQPLHDREEELLEIRDEFVRLLQASEPEDDAAEEKRAKDIEACGKKLLTSGLAFQATLQEFLAGKTRRGLGEEIDRVRNSVQLIQEMLVQYRRLAGHTVTPFTPGSTDHKQLRAWWIDLLRKELQWRIAPGSTTPACATS